MIVTDLPKQKPKPISRLIKRAEASGISKKIFDGALSRFNSAIPKNWNLTGVSSVCCGKD